MTLEGEYYLNNCVLILSSVVGRNPHDIGRRILLAKASTAILSSLSRNPHDIGRRILPAANLQNDLSTQFVAILMTLEGEYYAFWLMPHTSQL